MNDQNSNDTRQTEINRAKAKRWHEQMMAESFVRHRQRMDVLYEKIAKQSRQTPSAPGTGGEKDDHLYDDHKPFLSKAEWLGVGKVALVMYGVLAVLGLAMKAVETAGNGINHMAEKTGLSSISRQAPAKEPVMGTGIIRINPRERAEFDSSSASDAEKVKPQRPQNNLKTEFSQPAESKLPEPKTRASTAGQGLRNLAP